MGLDAVGSPDPLDRAQREADPLRDGAPGPVRQIRWIVRNARPTRSATARPVQCVTSPGGSEQVMART